MIESLINSALAEAEGVAMPQDTRPGPQAKYSKHIKETNLNLISLATLKEIFDKHFADPFLPQGLVKTRWVESSREKTLQVNIGRRDVWINEKGEVTAAGTNLLDGVTDTELERAAAHPHKQIG